MTPKALLVGCGAIGRRHLRNLHSLGVQDLLAFDPDPSCARQAREESGAVLCATLEEGLARKPDVVLVCTPSHLHVEPALAAARAGVHLFIEKPLAHRLKNLDALETEVSSRKLVALVGCNMRFHPGIVQAKSLVSEKSIGRPLLARATSSSYLPDWRPGRDYRQTYSASVEQGGGAVLDCIHEIDYLLDLFGDAAKVTALAGNFGSLGIEAEDAAEIAWTTRGGTLVSLRADYLSRSYHRTLRIDGTDGALEWDFLEPEVRLYNAAAKTWKSLPLPEGGLDRMYVDEMRHLLACLDGRERPKQGLAEGRRALTLALAAKESSRGGRCVEIQGQG